MAYSPMIAGYDPQKHDGSYYYDEHAAERPIAFIERLTGHTKGRKARTPLLLSDFQKDFIRTLFGWKDADGFRRYRTALLELPRGNGKTTLAAAISCYMLCADREKGGECYLAATTKEQAEKTYEVAAQMVRQGPLRAKLKALNTRQRILHPKSNSYLCTIAHDHRTANALNVHFLCCDEMHVWEGTSGRDFFTSLESGMGKRDQPLMLITSTAGHDRTSVFWDLHDFGCRVRINPLLDQTFLPAIYAADPQADWTAEETWKSCNPNWGNGVEPKHLRTLCDKARAVPSFENEFKRKHLNLWTEQADKWLSMDDVYGCPSEEIDLSKEPCTGGLDTSSTTDLTAFSLYFPSKKAVRTWFFIPGENAYRRSLLDGVDYKTWQKDERSNITFTNSKRIDRGELQKKIVEISKQYRIGAVAFDPWEGKIGLATDLMQSGLRMVEYTQGYSNMNAPTKQFEEMIAKRELNYGGCQCFAWNCSNLTVKEHNGSIRPVKPEDQSKRIDGCVAAIMAIGISKGQSTAKIIC